LNLVNLANKWIRWESRKRARSRFFSETQTLADQPSPLLEGESREWIANTPEAGSIVTSGRMIVKYLDNQNFGVKLLVLCSHDVEAMQYFSS